MVSSVLGVSGAATRRFPCDCWRRLPWRQIFLFRKVVQCVAFVSSVSRCFLSLSNHIHRIRRPRLVFSPLLRMGERLRIRCAIVSDIDFEMMGGGQTTRVKMEPTDAVDDLVEAVQKLTPTLRQYDLHSFRVLRILRPVQTAAAGANAPEVSKLREKEDPLSLDPILQRLRERTREANKTELANEYVKVLSHVFEIQDYFKHEEAKLISAIVVRLAAPGESSLAVPHIPFDTI